MRLLERQILARRKGTSLDAVNIFIDLLPKDVVDDYQRFKLYFNTFIDEGSTLLTI